MMKRVIAPVSVVIPCYCCRNTIERAIASVAAQTVWPAEVLLVEDCSGDGTLELLYQIQRLYLRNWIKIIELPANCGPGTARNAGWRVAAQPYIAFLDADDSWHPQKIEIQYGWMHLHPEVVLSAHVRAAVGSNQAPRDEPFFSSEKAVFVRQSAWHMLLSNRFPTTSVMLRRDIPQRFAEGKRHAEDFLLWLEICLSGAPCARTTLPLAYLYKAPFGEGGLSGDMWMMEKGELDTYRRIWKAGLLGHGKGALLVGWSLVKYMRRVVRAGFRSLW